MPHATVKLRRQLKLLFCRFFSSGWSNVSLGLVFSRFFIFIAQVIWSVLMYTVFIYFVKGKKTLVFKKNIYIYCEFNPVRLVFFFCCCCLLSVRERPARGHLLVRIIQGHIWRWHGRLEQSHYDNGAMSTFKEIQFVELIWIFNFICLWHHMQFVSLDICL